MIRKVSYNMNIVEYRRNVKGYGLTSPHKFSLLDSSLASSYTSESTSKLRSSVALLWPPLSSL